MTVPKSYRPEVGDVVTYDTYHDAIVSWGNNDRPYMLILGRQYTIESVDVRRSHTKVQLKGIIGSFNSAHFSLHSAWLLTTCGSSSLLS